MIAPCRQLGRNGCTSQAARVGAEILRRAPSERRFAVPSANPRSLGRTSRIVGVSHPETRSGAHVPIDPARRSVRTSPMVRNLHSRVGVRRVPSAARRRRNRRRSPVRAPVRMPSGPVRHSLGFQGADALPLRFCVGYACTDRNGGRLRCRAAPSHPTPGRKVCQLLFSKRADLRDRHIGEPNAAPPSLPFPPKAAAGHGVAGKRPFRHLPCELPRPPIRAIDRGGTLA